VQFFNIRDIENLTGIKAHTLRIWEKRYGILVPLNTPGKHRLYDNNDLKKILLISSLYHSGYKISKIALMYQDEIAINTLHLEKKTNFEVFINRFIEFTIDMKEEEFKKLFSELREAIDDKDLFSHIVFPLLYRIGNLLMIGNLLPIQEHFASNLIRTILIKSIDGINYKTIHKTKKVLLFCPQNEHHELPLLFLHFIFKQQGTKVIYLGPNTRLETLAYTIEKMQPTHAFVYLITNFAELDINVYLTKLSEITQNCNLFCGGPGFKDATEIPIKTKVFKNFETLIKTADAIGSEN
jgi:DNA-binding transcriptional MerR regulator